MPIRLFKVAGMLMLAACGASVGFAAGVVLNICAILIIGRVFPTSWRAAAEQVWSLAVIYGIVLAATLGGAILGLSLAFRKINPHPLCK